MNIIILSSSKGQAGGVERFSFYLRDAYSAAGHSVTILGREDVTGFLAMILKWSRYVGMQQPFLGWVLGRKALKQGFDVCVTNGMLGWNLENKKTINVQHGTFARAAVRIDKNTNFFKYLIKFYVWGSFEGVAARRAKACVAVSGETKESVEMYYHAKSVRVIENAVDTELFRPRSIPESRVLAGLPLDKTIIVFDGRFEYAKGLPIIMGFLKNLERMNAHMVIAIHPDESVIEKYPVTMRIFTQQELALVYSAADLFLLPSLHEGSSYALLQAMSSGLPFLASPVGLASDLLKERAFPECVVVDQNIETYLARADNLLFLNSHDQGLLTLRLREYILQSHSIEVFNKAYNALVHEIL